MAKARGSGGERFGLDPKVIKAAKKVSKHLLEAKYTDVITGVPGTGVVLHGHHPRPAALAMARRHFEMAAARAHAALEALDANRFSVRYRSGVDIVERAADDGADKKARQGA